MRCSAPRRTTRRIGVERIVLAAAVPEGVLLDPPTHVVDGGLGQAHRVEGVQDHDRVGQSGAQGPLVAPEGVEGGDLHPGAPVGSALVEPVGDHRARAAFHHVQ